MAADAADEAVDPGFTIYDQTVGARGRALDVPRLVATALSILHRAAPYDLWLVVVLQVLGGVLLAVEVLAGRGILQGLLDAEQHNGSLSDFAWPLVAFGVAGLLSGMVGAVMRREQQLLGELTARHVQSRLHDVACAVELGELERPAFHDRLARAQQSLWRPVNLVFALAALASAVVSLCAMTLTLVAIQPLLLGLVVVAVAPALLLSARQGDAYYVFACRMTPRERERSYLAGLLSDKAAARELRTFGADTFVRARHDALSEERIRELRLVLRRQLAWSLAVSFAISVLVGGSLLVLAELALNGHLSLADLGAAAGAVVLLGARVSNAGWAVGSLWEAALFLSDVKAFEDAVPQTQDAGAPVPQPFERLIADAIRFTYPAGHQPALVDASIEIGAGEVVALVGENGCGKTTLAKILAGLYEPDAGTVRWNGVDATGLDRRERRAQVAVIFQDFVRYSLQARLNVAMGRPALVDDLQAVRAAAGAAGVDELLDGLPQGYETVLGPEFFGGTDLSVGQWQRVALARAFIRDAPLVILDEPTAALDPKAEHELFDRIRTLLAGRAVLLISHRFSTVRTADRIYVLHDGRIAEAGSHDELMAGGGRYAELFTLQASAYVTARPG